MAEGLRKHRHVFIKDSQIIYYDEFHKLLIKKSKYRCYMPNCNCHYIEEEIMDSIDKPGGKRNENNKK